MNNNISLIWLVIFNIYLEMKIFHPSHSAEVLQYFTEYLKCLTVSVRLFSITYWGGPHTLDQWPSDDRGIGRSICCFVVSDF